MESGYLLRALHSPAIAYQFHVSANGVTRYGLSHNAIKSVVLPVPPFPEQSAIVRFLDEATIDLDRARNSAQREIDLLREYHTRLIADVVTGKVDVHEAAGRLPEEEAEWEDESPEEGEMDAAGLDESEGGAHEEQ
jgi:type I restriction enzyme S subunit